ncbi:MAG: zinc-dependent metalloprotease [Pseudomonadota bacterium]
MKHWMTSLAAAMALLVTSGLYAADGDAADAKDDDKKAPKTIAQLTENHVSTPGLLTVYQDEKTGAIKLHINKSLLDQELVYFAQAADGVVQTGYFRGAYLANDVIVLRRRFDRIDIVKRNTSYYFDPDNALSRAADANISDALVASEKILAEDAQTGAVLINADKLFTSESLLQIKPSPDPDADPKAFSLGKLADDKSRVLRFRSYPQNTDIEVEYVYGNAAPTGATGNDITDNRYVAVRVLHSLIAMPDNDYQPRFDDPRVGYFMDTVTDLTQYSATPFRDMINRWHLVKKNPDAPVSDPVEPITFWIENTTPLEWRELIRSAALNWNQSFAKAGFSNAIVIKVQPDDAQWDAGDIRYNVLRWTSSPNPPFGGYGPSFSNPRTGQILGADIMLEYSFLNRYAFARQILSRGGELLADAPASLVAGEFCSLAHGLHSESQVARGLAIGADGDGAAFEAQLVHDSMHYLILHEIGHTLGLNHNMKATQLRSPAEAFDPDALDGGVLAGSIMDYPAVNFAPEGATQTVFYSTRPGPYDDWAIQFGYDPSLDDPVRREALLARSTEAALAFGNDADDMRSAGKGIDPRVNIYDMTNDAIGYADARMQMIADALGKLPSKPPAAGESYQQTHDVFVQMMRSWSRSAAAVSRFVGGVYVNRAMVGQPGAEPPYTAVDVATQRRAMQVLAERVFAPDVLDPALPALRFVAQQRRGFNFFANPEDPKVHDTLLVVQGAALDHLLHPNVLKRLTDSALYGNEYALTEAVDALTDAVFAADARGNVNTARQNLQVNYVERLADIVKGGAYDNVSQSAAILALQGIESLGKRKRGINRSTEAHVAHLQLLIDRALDDD